MSMGRKSSRYPNKSEIGPSPDAQAPTFGYWQRPGSCGFRAAQTVSLPMGDGFSAIAEGGNRIFDNRKQLMKVAEVLSFLNISRAHLYKQMKTKGLPYVKVDGSTRFEKEAVELWLKYRRHNS